MQKKRLEEALNAGRLISLGYNLNFSKPTKLNLLYYINSLTNQVTYNEKNTHLNEKKAERIESSDEEESDNSEKTSFKNQQQEDDEFEKLEVLCLKINPNTNIIVTGDSNGDIKVYDVFSSSRITVKNLEKDSSSQIKSNCPFNIKDLNKFSNSVTYNMPTICIKWYPYSNYSTNLVYFANVNGYLGILDVNTLDKSIIIEESDEISCIDFNSEGSCFASVGKDSMIRLYDSNFNNNSSSFNKLIKKYGSNKESEFNELSKSDPSVVTTHSNRLQAVKFSNSSNDIFYTGGWDRTVKTWDRRTQHGVVGSINGPFICGSDAIDVNDTLLITASWVKENSLELWDIRNNKKHVSKISIFGNDQELRKKSNGEYLYACKFFSTNNVTNNRDSTILVCGSGTQSLHLIDYNQPIQKQNLNALNCESPLYCLDSVNKSNIIACGGMKKFFVFNSTNDI